MSDEKNIRIIISNEILETLQAVWPKREIPGIGSKFDFELEVVKDRGYVIAKTSNFEAAQLLLKSINTCQPCRIKVLCN